MLSKMIRLLALPMLLLYSGSAFALIDAEAEIGKRWYRIDTSPKVTVSSEEIALAAHIDPIPLIPVSFGLRLSQGTLNKDDLKSSYGASDIGTNSLFEAGVDVMVWIPLIPIITPYARVDLPVYGQWKVAGTANGQSFSETAAVSGAQVSLGAKYQPLPLISILLEYTLGAEQWKETDAKVNGQGIGNDSKTHGLTSSAVFVGVEVRL